MTDRSSPINVALLWHTFGHGNLGVDALARGSANIIRQAADSIGVSVRFTSLGTGQNYQAANLPADVRIGPAPRIKPLLYGKSDFLSAIRRSDVVFDIGEGDSFTDIYGLQRYAFLLGSKLAVIAAGRPLIIAPQTIGPFENGIRCRLATSVMKRATAVYTRDGLSTQFLQANGITENIDEFIDVAFALPFQVQQKPVGKTRVGVNVSGLLYNGGYTGKNELGMTLDYKQLTHTVLETLSARDNVEVHLISHVVGSGGADDDYPVMNTLVGRYPHLIAAPKFATSESAKGYISGMDYVIAGRMHVCIGAFSAGVPVMPIAYSRKFNGLFGSLGYRHMIDGKASSTADALNEVVRGFDMRQELSSDVQTGLREAERRLDRYRDRVASILYDLRRF
jgi:polysaccharide pyruvyl transferase WcaK-like protein